MASTSYGFGPVVVNCLVMSSINEAVITGIHSRTDDIDYLCSISCDFLRVLWTKLVFLFLRGKSFWLFNYTFQLLPTPIVLYN